MLSRAVLRTSALMRSPQGLHRLAPLTQLSNSQHRLASLRQFSRTSMPLNASQSGTQSVTEEEKQEESIVESMGGWVPLVGLTAVAMIGKEFIIINGAGLNIVFFYGFWGILYMTQGEGLTKMFYDDLEALRKNFLYDPLDYAIENYKQTIISFKAQTHILNYIRDVAKHSPLSVKAEAEALNKKAALDAREKIVASLSAQKSLQQLKNLNVELILQENFAEDVELAWEGVDQKDKDEFLENQLKDLEAGVKTNLALAKDPIKRVYKSVLEQYAQKLQPFKKEDVVAKAKAWPVDVNLL